MNKKRNGSNHVESNLLFYTSKLVCISNFNNVYAEKKCTFYCITMCFLLPLQAPQAKTCERDVIQQQMRSMRCAFSFPVPSVPSVPSFAHAHAVRVCFNLNFNELGILVRLHLCRKVGLLRQRLGRLRRGLTGAQATIQQ